ncbi:MAG: isoprenylcysteine carboxylmethyltransferase family protein [Terracidiphilus sp.]
MTIRMMVFALFSVAFQVGLAILGWGGFAAFFSNPARVAMGIVILVLTVASLFSSGNLSSGQKEDRGNRWVFIAITVLALLLAYLPAYTDRKGILVIDGDTTRWIGVGLSLVGGWLRLWPVFVLGNRFSGLVAIQPGHTLVTTGIYRKIRNPSYLGLLVGTLGWALVFRSEIGVVIAVLMVLPLLGRMNAEEKLLREHFGSEYDAYFARTKRLIPGIY